MVPYQGPCAGTGHVCIRALCSLALPSARGFLFFCCPQVALSLSLVCTCLVFTARPVQTVALQQYTHVTHVTAWHGLCDCNHTIVSSLHLPNSTVHPTVQCSQLLGAATTGCALAVCTWCWVGMAVLSFSRVDPGCRGRTNCTAQSASTAVLLRELLNIGSWRRDKHTLRRVGAQEFCGPG
jgi:hypothetical protein